MAVLSCGLPVGCTSDKQRDGLARATGEHVTSILTSCACSSVPSTAAMPASSVLWTRSSGVLQASPHR